MDGSRFDEIARAISGRVSRRGVARGVLGAALGVALGKGGQREAAAACGRYGRSCVGGKCCNGATCINGTCRCPAGAQTCQGANGTACAPVCEFGEVLGNTCQCRCAATGRPITGEPCECLPCGAPSGRSVCGTSEISEVCVYSNAVDGTCVCFQPVCFPDPVPCSAASPTCPDGFACVNHECCGEPFCAALCGTDIPLPTRVDGESSVGSLWV